MKALALPALLLLAGGLAACADATDSAPSSQGDDATATTYVSLFDFNDSQFQDAWYDINRSLNAQFDQVCGDTFCEGDYANITPLTLACAVSSKLGSVHDCAWTFAASSETVDPAHAGIYVDAPTYQCHFKAKTTAGKLVTFLQGADSLQQPLPGTTTSIYDTLSDCFDHPIGGTSVDFPPGSTNSYVEASDYYASASGRAKWQAARDALDLTFDQICGDTYCSSDYADLQSMRFVCSVTKSTGNVKGCSWVFAGSYYTVDAAHGTVDDVSHSYNCPVPVHGTIGQLITTLTAAGNTPAIDRPLPGVTTSAYDAIGTNCLP